MQIIHEGADIPPSTRGAVLSPGVFDGVHVGHRAVVEHTLDLAARAGAASVVVTFDRHPASVVRPEAGVRLLTDLRQRAARLDELGVDVLHVLRFDEDRSLEAPHAFMHDLVAAFAPRAVVVGDDFHFGHRARGDLALLRSLGRDAGFAVEAVDPVALPGAGRVSSTAVRAAVAAGDVALAARLLGRSHAVRGVVEHGDKRGRTIGFPTANVAVAGDVQLPADGVYGGWYDREDGTRHRAAISVGRRPTFYEDNGLLLVEAYLLDFEGDLYGEHAEVVFDDWIRGQERFESVDDLVAQMQRDVDQVRGAPVGGG